MSLLWTSALSLLCTTLVVSTPVSISSSSQSLNVLNSSFSDEIIAAATVNQALNVTLPDPPEFDIWRVRGTPTFLRIAMLSHSLPRDDLNDVIFQDMLATTDIMLIPGHMKLDTNQTLFDAFRRHYIAKEQPLILFDDPYKSPSQWARCLINIRTHERGNPHLTYGVIANVLQGLWEYLCLGNRPREAAFEVHDDAFGFVGIGKVTRTSPTP